MISDAVHRLAEYDEDYGLTIDTLCLVSNVRGVACILIDLATMMWMIHKDGVGEFSINIPHAARKSLTDAGL